MNSWKKTFAIIWTGQLFSTLSSSVVGFAIVFWLSIETKSPGVLAYAMIAALLPQLLLGMFSGVFVDRWNRKLTMILADTFIALCTLVLCVMFYLGKVEVWQIYFMLAMRSAGSAFHIPAMQASVPLLAPESELMRVAGVNQIIYSISNIAGPALAAVLISFLDMTHILLIDVAGALIACTSLLFVTIPHPVRKNEGQKINIVAEVKEGIQAIFQKSGMGWLFTCDLVSMFFIVPVAALFPLMTLDHFAGNAYKMSLVEAAWGVGMLLGGVAIGLRQTKRVNKVMLIAVMCVVSGLTFLFSGMLPPSDFILFVLLTAIGGIAAAIWNGAFTVILQTKVDQSALGRAFSIYDSLMLMPSIPGLLATGLIAEHIGMSNAFIIAGAAISAMGCLLFLIPSVRKLG